MRRSRWRLRLDDLDLDLCRPLDEDEDEEVDDVLFLVRCSVAERPRDILRECHLCKKNDKINKYKRILP